MGLQQCSYISNPLLHAIIFIIYGFLDNSLAYFENWLTLKFHSSTNVLSQGFLNLYWNNKKKHVKFKLSCTDQGPLQI